jgi:hypothetical protein
MLVFSIGINFIGFYALGQAELSKHMTELNNANFYAVQIQQALDKFDEGDMESVRGRLERLKYSHVFLVELMRDSDIYSDQIKYAAGRTIKYIEANQHLGKLEE